MCDTTDLAELAEELGFHRYRVPEHHGMRGVASSAPPVLVGHLAAVTERLGVGAGGVLLPDHPPLVVAEWLAGPVRTKVRGRAPRRRPRAGRRA